MSWYRRLWKPSFARGVHPSEWKRATEERPIRRLEFAPRLILPLNQHIGAPSVPIVRKGQEVGRGEPIARADGFLSLPLHAPATGVIEEIGLVTVASGQKVPGIVLKVYEASTQEVLYATPRDAVALTPASIVQAVQDTGMAGMGGAAFPTHAKLKVRTDRPIDTLVANGCECEPYLTCDYRVMLEHPEDLIAGIELAMRALGAHRALVGIEDNKAQAIEALRARLPPHGRIRVEAVKTKYPQGSAELLIKVLMGCEVPAGGRSFDVGAVVQNVGTLAEIGRLIPQGVGLIERVVTVTGPGIRNPGNYMVPLGTPIRFVLEQAGFAGSYREVILGGPMMGTAIGSLDVPVTKGVSGILAVDHVAVAHETRRQYPCIKCGKCVEACPMGLNPTELGMLATRREYAAMQERYHLDHCIECGCCSFSCPSNIPLVQHFRIAKAMNHEAAQRAARAGEAA